MENKEIILVVDDNPELVDGVKLALEMEGFQALTAANGQEALELLARITPDLILADIMMPKMDGIKLYEKVHQDERWLQVPFIFLTAKTSKADIRLGKEMGIDDYITKPFETEDLIAAIRGRLRRMAEVTGRPPRTDVLENIKYAWHGKLGPWPVPLVTFGLAAAIVLATSLTASFFGSVRAAPMDQDRLRANQVDSEAVLIPAGPFKLGGTGANALPAQTIELPAFYIDRYEVTNQAFAQFLADTAANNGSMSRAYPEAEANHPVTSITWAEAQAFCQWMGKRLPTEAEWEKAARGADGRIFPWGNEWQVARANTRHSNKPGPSPVDAYPEGASPYGVEGLAGNVWEWVADWSDASQHTKVIRGGAWNAISQWAESAARNTAPPTASQSNLGFRCAYTQ